MGVSLVFIIWAFFNSLQFYIRYKPTSLTVVLIPMTESLQST